MSNEEKSEIEAKREAAADTNAGLYIRCLKFYQSIEYIRPPHIATFVAGEIAREREACAKIADAAASEGVNGPSWVGCAQEVAEAIRARGKS